MIGCLQRDNGQTKASSGRKDFITVMASSATGILLGHLEYSTALIGNETLRYTRTYGPSSQQFIIQKI